ncbi:hypothetical protein SUGI_1148380 [Cryptomeria japonica]|uniref:uncharacterized protein LOC131047481 n=1 Tax=Cryptomeria japonica TaxID=3369 RepID=UPI002414A07C|nr:uncharacterized protein LOC131047481 [Cryptomeria japonica]GLJ53800.1 hypothetical protein SUGI_1148380 [Cryptomeria japonica]
MAKSISKSFYSVGNCKIEVQGNAEYEEGKDELYISIDAAAKIKISVDKPRRYSTRRSHKQDLFNPRIKQGEEIPAECSFVCLNPKENDARTNALLEEVLKLYSKELPMMSYAANTGKESPFVERCVTGGKYCTLLLKSDAILGSEEVIAAITYQIIPPDTQYAEIPLASVSKPYQRKGFGRLLYGEVKKRLQDVGVLTLFCWGDHESEGFWLEQGFSTLAEVDGKGKARKLPIKNDVRRAMSMPGSATLLVSHLNGDNYASYNAKSLSPSRYRRQCKFLSPGSDNSKSKTSPVSHITTPIATEAKGSTVKLLTKKCCFEESMGPDQNIIRTDTDQSFPCEDANNVNVGSIENSPDKQACFRSNGIGAPMNSSDFPVKAEDGQLDSMAKGLNISSVKHYDDSPMKFCVERGIFNYKSVDTEETVVEKSSDIQKVNTPCLPQRRGLKRRGPAEESYSKSLKVIVDYQHDDITFAENEHNIFRIYNNEGGTVRASTASCLMREPLVEVIPSQTQASNLQQVLATKKVLSDNHLEDSTAERQQPIIMLMNMADERKKTKLTKIVEKMGGVVSSVGNICTHVVTGQVRRTLNFSTALCAGAWVVSPDWLKASFKENKFIDEMPFILKDKAFESKYGVNVEDAVLRARANLHKLLDGFHVYLTSHIQPPVEVLSSIVESAGGKVVLSLEKGLVSSHTFALTCEEDTLEALAAATTGMPTFTSDWFMCCIMKQEFDFSAPQFTESLQ